MAIGNKIGIHNDKPKAAVIKTTNTIVSMLFNII